MLFPYKHFISVTQFKVYHRTKLVSTVKIKIFILFKNLDRW